MATSRRDVEVRNLAHQLGVSVIDASVRFQGKDLRELRRAYRALRKARRSLEAVVERMRPGLDVGEATIAQLEELYCELWEEAIIDYEMPRARPVYGFVIA